MIVGVVIVTHDLRVVPPIYFSYCKIEFRLECNLSISFVIYKMLSGKSTRRWSYKKDADDTRRLKEDLGEDVIPRLTIRSSHWLERIIVGP